MEPYDSEDGLQCGKELTKRKNVVETARNVCLARTTLQMPPLRFAKPLQHRCAALQAAPLVRRRQVLILCGQDHFGREHTSKTLVFWNKTWLWCMDVLSLGVTCAKKSVVL